MSYYLFRNPRRSDLQSLSFSYLSIEMSGFQVPERLLQSVKATKVQYRQLGKSGLRVSVPILGCMGFGDPQALPWALGEDEVCMLPK